MIDERIFNETPAARGLPGEAFTSKEFLELEHRTIFTENWVCIGFAHEVAEPGDVHPLDFAGLPLLMVRDREGTVRVFHNVCPHRGMRVVREPGRKKRSLACPYHCWTYDLKGKLLSRPFFNGPDDPKGKVAEADDLPALSEIRTTCWFDAVFVNLDGKAPVFEEYARQFLDLVEPFGDRTVSHPVGKLDYDLKANWKLVLENAIDSYHIAWVHPGLQQSTPMENYIPYPPEGNICAGYAILASNKPGFGQADLPRWPGAKDTISDRMTYCLLFPNILVASTATRMAIFQVNPVAPDRTLERLYFYMPDENNPESEPHQQAFVESYREVNDEDIWAVEELHQSRHSPYFDGGRFSPHWDRNTHHFARLVAEATSRDLCNEHR